MLPRIEDICSQSCISSLVLSASDICGEMPGLLLEELSFVIELELGVVVGQRQFHRQQYLLCAFLQSQQKYRRGVPNNSSGGKRISRDR